MEQEVRNSIVTSVLLELMAACLRQTGDGNKKTEKDFIADYQDAHISGLALAVNQDCIICLRMR